MRRIGARRGAAVARRGLWSLLAAALVAPTVGCGYALVGQGSNIPDDIQRVYLEPLVNSTPRLELDQILTQAVLDELVTRRRFNMVRGPSEADAILRGTGGDPSRFAPVEIGAPFEVPAYAAPARRPDEARIAAMLQAPEVTALR